MAHTPGRTARLDEQPAAKGATLFNLADLDRDQLGPIENQPGSLPLLVWNVPAEVTSQPGGYAEQGGRFVRPVPTPRGIERGR